MLFPFNVEMQLSQNKSTLLSELLQTVCVCVCVLLLPRVSSLYFRRPDMVERIGSYLGTSIPLFHGMREHGDYNYNDTGTSGAA